MNTALVTGATGMLGSYIVEQLLEEGWRVRCLIRRVGEANWLEELGGEPVRGDLLDEASLLRAATGCDALFHAAAAIAPGGEWAPFRAANVDGTASVVEAARRASARVVFVSSTAVFGRQRYFPDPTDEHTPLPLLPERDAYGRSKQLAERLVLEAHARGRVWATVVRPPVMYGRKDRQFAPRIGPVLERGLFPLIGGGRTTLPFVYAGAVAEGALLAALSDVSGGRVYHLTTDFDLTVADFVRLAGEGLDRTVRSPSVPVPLARAAFRILAGTLQLFGHGELAPHAAGTLEMLSRDNPFSSQRARQELGWQPGRPPETTLPEAFRFWKANRVSGHASA